MTFVALGKKPPTANGSSLNEEHFHTALLETAELVEGWLESVVINGEKMVLAPKQQHLETLARKLRQTIGEEKE